MRELKEVRSDENLKKKMYIVDKVNSNEKLMDLSHATCVPLAIHTLP